MLSMHSIVRRRGWVKLNPTSGHYVALCFVPDRTTGTPHFALGMITSLSVQ
jgi:hypothetical protein